MLNSIFNLFHIGNTTQTNTISINPKIDVTLERIEKDFSDGNFKQAVEDLDELIKDNSSEALKSIKYQLLLIKANFLMQFRKIDEFQEFIEYIEKEYKTFVNHKFKELKLTLFALTNNEKFFELSKQLRLEIPNSLSQRHLNIIFYLNSRDVEKAKELFEEEIIITQSRNKLLLIGGHIYSNLYRDDKEDISIFNNADMYYRELLNTEQISFLDKMQIQEFYAITLINKNLQCKTLQDNFLFNVEEYKKSLDVVFENEAYFNPEYIKTLIENYSYILSYFGQKDIYNEFYKKHENDLSIKHYIQYCTVNNLQFNHQKIQESILKNPQLDDLLIYMSLILHGCAEDIDEIIKFLNANNKFIYKDNSILYHYVKAHILQGTNIETEIFKYLEDNQYRDLNILLAYIESNLYVKNQIHDADIAKLIEFSLAEDNFFIRILHVIKLLQKLGKRTEYLDLALKKQNIFSNIIFETLKICYEDENLLFQDFEFFINKIVNKDFYGDIIGHIYARFDRPDIAFNYYYSEYKKNNDDLEILFTILQVVSDYYNKSHQILEETKQREIFNALVAKEGELNLEGFIFLLTYALYILKDTRQILPLLNQKLLNTDIKNLDNALKIKLSNIFMTQFESNHKDLFLYDLNLCLVQDGTTYVKNNYIIVKENQKNFGFIVIDTNEYFLKKQDGTSKEKSLFHRIVGPFAFRCGNPNMIPIPFDKNSENLLSGPLAFMEEQTNQTKNLFQRYSDNTFQGLYTLANRNYKNYFTLIPYLLNNKNMNFNSLHVNYLPKETKKILTLSSIVFLYEINQLDVVLQRDDIVIQQTLVNWLKEYLQKIDFSNMPQNFTYLDEEGHKFIPFTEDSIKEAEKFKTFVLGILTRILKCTIINDIAENLSLKEAKTLAPLVGIQEYQALAYCIKYNYQIISENNIFDILFETLRFNKGFISNATVLLEDSLEYDKRRSLIIDLHQKNYKYILSENFEKSLIAFMQEKNVLSLQQEEFELIKIANSYGFLENIKKYYNDKFKVLFPKAVLPIKIFLDKNIEKLLVLFE